jgi:hypothetical protein
MAASSKTAALSLTPHTNTLTERARSRRRDSHWCTIRLDLELWRHVRQHTPIPIESHVHSHTSTIVTAWHVCLPCLQIFVDHFNIKIDELASASNDVIRIGRTPMPFVYSQVAACPSDEQSVLAQKVVHEAVGVCCAADRRTAPRKTGMHCEKGWVSDHFVQGGGHAHLKCAPSSPSCFWSCSNLLRLTCLGKFKF